MVVNAFGSLYKSPAGLRVCLRPLLVPSELRVRDSDLLGFVYADIALGFEFCLELEVGFLGLGGGFPFLREGAHVVEKVAERPPHGGTPVKFPGAQPVGGPNDEEHDFKIP